MVKIKVGFGRFLKYEVILVVKLWGDIGGGDIGLGGGVWVVRVVEIGFYLLRRFRI